MAIDSNINRIKFLRSTTAGKVPTASLLESGEIAINLVDRTIYSVNGSNVVELGFGKGGTVTGSITAPGFVGPLTGNAATATTLATARTINGTSFNGSANITTSNWGTSRTLKIGDTGKAVNGSANITWTLAEIGAVALKDSYRDSFLTSVTYVTSSDTTYADFNSLPIGRYLISSGNSILNKPSCGGDPFFYVEVKNTYLENGSYGYLQTATGYSNSVTEMRSIGSGSWGAWKQVAFTSDDSTGNAASATKLQTARTINGTSFNGTANITTANWGTSRTLTIGNTGKAVNGSGNVSWSLADIGALPLTGGALTGQLEIASAGSSWIKGTSGDTSAIKIQNATASNYHAWIQQTTNAGNGIAIGLLGETFHVSFATADNISNGNNTSLQTFSVNTSGAAVNGTLNVYNGSISGTLDGNASTATTLATARTINGTSFNGSANITTANWGTARNLTIGNTAKSVNGSGNVAWTLAEIGALGASANAVSATTADKLSTARTLSWTGDVTGSTTFDGTANRATAMTLANSGVSAGTYKSVTVDAKGRVTAGTSVVTSLVTSTSATGTTNVATANGTTYLNIVENVGGTLSSVGSSTQVTGAGSVTVTSDTSGKLTITGAQTITGNAATATTLATARTINGTSFNGSANITTSNWGTARNLTVGNTAKSVNGSANISWSLAEIGALGASANAVSATKLATARTIQGVAFDGTSNINVIDDALEYSIIMWPSATVPSGYVACQGQSISSATYPKLWSIFGGSLPDLRGVFVRGLDSGRGIDSGRTVRSFQDDAMRAFGGEFGSSGANAEWFRDTMPASGAFYMKNIGSTGRVSEPGRTSGNYTNFACTLDNSRVTQTAGENRPKNVALLYIVKLG